MQFSLFPVLSLSTRAITSADEISHLPTVCACVLCNEAYNNGTAAGCRTRSPVAPTTVRSGRELLTLLNAQEMPIGQSVQCATHSETIRSLDSFHPNVQIIPNAPENTSGCQLVVVASRSTVALQQFEGRENSGASYARRHARTQILAPDVKRSRSLKH